MKLSQLVSIIYCQNDVKPWVMFFFEIQNLKTYFQLFSTIFDHFFDLFDLILLFEKKIF